MCRFNSALTRIAVGTVLVLIAACGVIVERDGPEKYKTEKNGAIYYFSNPIAKMLFGMLPGRIEKADSNWTMSAE